MRGRYKGRVGYYDNEADAAGCAIVYLDTPFVTPYVVVRHASLEPTNVPHLGLSKLETSLPHVAKQMGTFCTRRPQPRPT